MNLIKTLLIVWAIWPGSMWLVGFLMETRVVPVWHNQAKAFIPGDLMLGIMFLALWEMPDPTCDQKLLLGCQVLADIGAVTLFHWLRSKEASCYEPGAMNSPTKLWHDLMGYAVFPHLYITLGIPKLVYGLWTEGVRSLLKIHWFIFAIAANIYITCLVYDGVTVKDPSAVAKIRHPGSWAPAWTKEGRQRLANIFRGR